MASLISGFLARRWVSTAVVVFAGASAFLLVQGADPEPAVEERLARYRNLGKAFYENPTTQTDAVEEFRKALALQPNSARERLNYGLALLRAGKTQEGIAELERVQKQDPKLPHTWFNLGIQYKKQGLTEKAIEQFKGMARLVPDEPITHYNLGALYKLTGQNETAAREFELAAKLDPNLAAPHFQLFNIYRIEKRTEDAQRELATFQRLKKAQEGSVTPEDVEWNAYAEIYDIMADKPAPDVPAALKFSARNVATGATGVARLGRESVLTWGNDGVRLNGGPVIAGTEGATYVAVADFNNDGAEDFCVLTPKAPALFINNKGSFAKADAALPAGDFHTAVWLDFDHDYDLDLFLLGSKSVLLRNQGAAGFAPAEFPFAAGEAIAATVFRLIPDTKGMDLLVSYKDRPGVLYVDRLAGKYEAIDTALPAGAAQLRAADVMNDGWIAVVYSDARGLGVLQNREGKLQQTSIATSNIAGGLAVSDLENRGLQDVIAGGTVYRNLGNGKFQASAKSPFPACTATEAGDLNGDGRNDIICISEASAKVFTNETETKNHWIAVSLTGVKNLKLAPGTEVEVKAGPRYQKKLYDGSPLSFGLGTEKQADTVRISWANGLIQNEMKQPADKTYTYQEAQRLSGSCPIIWTWNGQEFEYITDVLGVAPLGASSADGQYFPVDHNEYIQIPGESLKAVNGRYEVRITEELAEVSYLDQVQLIALDHPGNQPLYTNDKFKSPPFPEFRLFGVERRVVPIAAKDSRGRDVLARVLHKDRTYPEDFSRNLRGVADLHTLDLDFGRGVAKDGKAILVLSGWVDWADGSTFLSASQESKIGLVTPYLQVKDRQGRWVTVIDDMGMPAGKPKTIVVDLVGKWLSESREVRIVTNLCVYWDEVFLAEGEARPTVTQSVVPALTSNLRFRGFSPAVIHPQRKQPELFTYASAKPYSMWNPTPGLYTRYGPVEELTSTVDDKFVIMGSGDELRMTFDATALPPLRPGWKRDFLLLVDGWAKDRDANTAYSQTVEPLPFHSMTRFPYPASERYPDDPEHERYRKTYNTRPALRLIQPLARR